MNKLLLSEGIRKAWALSEPGLWMTGNSGALPEPARSTLRWHSFHSWVNKWAGVLSSLNLISDPHHHSHFLLSLPTPDFLSPDAASKVAKFFIFVFLPSRRIWVRAQQLQLVCTGKYHVTVAVTACKLCPGCNKNHITKGFHFTEHYFPCLHSYSSITDTNWVSVLK